MLRKPIQRQNLLPRQQGLLREEHLTQQSLTQLRRLYPIFHPISRGQVLIRRRRCGPMQRVPTLVIGSRLRRDRLVMTSPRR